MPVRDLKRLKCGTPLADKQATEDFIPSFHPQVLELPVELWLEIISYFPAVPIPTLRIARNPVLPPSTLERGDVLRALSQTCRTLRKIFFQQAWERLEVCAIRTERSSGQNHIRDYCVEGLNYGRDQIPGSWYLDVSRTVQTKCEGLSRHPEYAALIRVVNVVLTRCSAKTVLPAFARCLDILPSLDTLQILRAHTQMTTHLKKHFEGRSFPSIQTVILPTHAHEIMRCCKQAKTVVCNYGDGSQLVTAIGIGGKKVERLEGFTPDEHLMKRIVKAAPNLRTIKFNGSVTPNALRILSLLKNITSIELRTRQEDEEKISQDPELVACIKVAKDILRKAEGQRALTIRHESYTLFTLRKWMKKIDVN